MQGEDIVQGEWPPYENLFSSNGSEGSSPSQSTIVIGIRFVG
jgi:hypothetical protein